MYTFMKLKAEASGYPGWVQSPEDEDRYVESFWQSEVIKLEKEAIWHNSAKRGLAKLTERNDRTMTKIFTEPKQLYGFLSTSCKEARTLCFSSDDLVWISWKYGAEEDVPIQRNRNEVVRVYFTAGARIHLYR